VLPIEDDMGKAGDGIFSTLRVAALIQQTGGGNGFSFSRLRPKNDIVHTSSGRATGPVGFLRVYDQAFGEIAQGGSRRGANMGVLRVDHPDIEEFIGSKAEEGKIANFNISVAITDEFMTAVRDDTDFDLRNPRDGKVWRSVRARDLFAKIVKYAHHNGEPGALFIDAANRTNRTRCRICMNLEATNPCVTGELVSGDSFGRFFEQIRLSHPNKQMRIEEAALHSNFTGGNWAAKVIKVVPAGTATVYDLYEPKSDTWITEGYVSRGCGEQWLGSL
jgi:ribonucleotide reductase alpha subunit